MGFNITKFSSLYFLCFFISVDVIAAEIKKHRPVFITPGVLAISISSPHSDEKITLSRNQDRTARIDSSYTKTSRGKINKMQPFGLHDVETIGELMVIDYLKQLKDNPQILIIDSRTPPWYNINGHIPFAINIPSEIFKDQDKISEYFEDDFGVILDGTLPDYTYAKTLVIYCNGIWCGKTPEAINNLLKYGYPASKIKYYRGGMQSWKSLGLTVIKNPFKKNK
jgi:rhodanese-related sulfurtransferase